MNERVSNISSEKLTSIRKKNIQAVLGLLKMKNKEHDNEFKNYRVQKNEFQKNVLRDVFRLTRFPSKPTRDDLALLLNHTNRGIQIWFQNQRNNREENEEIEEDSPEKIDKSKRLTIDIITLIDIIENNIPRDKKIFGDNIINYSPQFY